jgi:hypothetical protein
VGRYVDAPGTCDLSGQPTLGMFGGKRKIKGVGQLSMNDAEIFYKAINALVDRELKVKAITSRAMADALMLVLSKLIETEPDPAQQKELRIRIYEHLERIAKDDHSLH